MDLLFARGDLYIPTTLLIIAAIRRCSPTTRLPEAGLPPLCQMFAKPRQNVAQTLAKFGKIADRFGTCVDQSWSELADVRAHLATSRTTKKVANFE